MAPYGSGKAGHGHHHHVHYQDEIESKESEHTEPLLASSTSTWEARHKRQLRRRTMHLLAFTLMQNIVLVLLVFHSYGWDLARFSRAEKHYSVSHSLADILAGTVMLDLVLAMFVSNPGAYYRTKACLLYLVVVIVLLGTKAFMFKRWGNTSAGAVLVIALVSEIYIATNVRSTAKESEPRFWRSLKDAEELEDGKNEKKLNYSQVFTILKPYFWPGGWKNRFRAMSTWFVLAVAKSCSIVSPIYMAAATNALTTGDLALCQRSVLAFCLLQFISKALRELQSYIYLDVKQTAFIETTEMTFAHIHRLSLQWHLTKKMGNVLRSMNRGVQAANNVVTYLFLFLMPTIVECLVVCVIFALHFRIPLLSIIAFASLALYGYVTVKLTIWRKKFREETNKHDNELNEKATDSLTNFETVKYFTNEEYEIQSFSSAVRKYMQFSTSTQASLNVLNTSQQLIVQAAIAMALAIAAAPYVIDHEHGMTVGGFVAVSVYLNQLFQPLNFLGTIYNVVIQALVDMQNLSELLAERPDLADEPNAKPLSFENARRGAKIEFRDVTFHYPGQPAIKGLKHVSFVVKPGTITALVGHTGSGKTTVSRLLFRFYDVHSGSILVNDQDVRGLQQRSLRMAIGVVPQDTVLFNDTLLHNIKYGRLDATQKEVEDACREAQILPFIESLPEKWNTVVGERGLKLSGGEKQRVAIARTLLKNPPIVILDEATSALDSITEMEIQRALQTLSKNRTMLVIAHRLSTVREADQIVVMDGGEIEEIGRHQELLQKKGRYHDLWNIQARGTDPNNGEGAEETKESSSHETEAQ